MRENVVAGHFQTPELSERIASEIRQALEELKKYGYKVHFEQIPEQRDELALVFQLGETQQTLRLKSGDWNDAGTIHKLVLNRLDI